MPTNLFDLSEIVDKDVFTSKGAYCGKVRDIDIDLPRFRVKSVIVDAARGSYLAKKVGGKKAVIVPYRMVTAIGDVVMIKHFTGDVSSEKEDNGYEKEIAEEPQ